MLRKLLSIFAFSLFACGSYAQIPNGGFENWTNMGTYDEPTDWITLNILTVLGIPATTYKSTDAHGGSFSAENRCVEYTGFSGLDTICGAVIGYWPFTQRPLNIEGWYQLVGAGTDYSCYLGVDLTKWDSINGDQDSIGAGIYGTTTSTGANWTYFNLPIQYYSADNPDSLAIAFGVTGDPNSLMRLDDLAFNGSVSTADAMQTLKWHIYPNPAAAQLNISFAADSRYELKIISLEGKNMLSTVVEGFGTDVSLENIPAGIYFVNAMDLKTGSFATERLSVLK